MAGWDLQPTAFLWNVEQTGLFTSKTPTPISPAARPGNSGGSWGVSCPSAYLCCTLPWARGLLQFSEGPRARALGAGVGAPLLGLGQGLCQAGLGHGLDLLQGLGQELEMNLHHSQEAAAQHLENIKHHPSVRHHHYQREKKVRVNIQLHSQILFPKGLEKRIGK